jgi:hypothetical protein
MPKLQLLAPDSRPSRVDGFHNLLWQRPFVQSSQIVLEMMRATGTDDDSITILFLQLRMMLEPSQATF